MTKKWHKCDKCKGINGIYVKICEATGEPIEDYKIQLRRQTETLYTKENNPKHG